VKAPAAVFLDRDGLIIEDVSFIRNPDDARLIPGAAQAIAVLNRRAVPAIVVTNQSGIARGLLTIADYEAVRRRVDELLAENGAHIDANYYCPDYPAVSGSCECRKPGTKLFRDAMRDIGVAPANSAYIGDRWRDVAPATALGGRGILVPSTATTPDDLRRADEAGIEKAATLQEAVDLLFTLTEPTSKK